MKYVQSIIFSVLISGLTLIFYGCPDTDPEPPKKVIMVAKSVLEAPIEQGIDSENYKNNQSIVLMWYPNIEDDLAGYKVYRKPDFEGEETFAEIQDIKVAISSTEFDTVFYDENVELNPMIEYSYFVKAYDLVDNLSDPSDTLKYAVSTTPLQVLPINNQSVHADTLKFRWFDDPWGALFSEEYVIRVQNVDNSTKPKLVWLSRFINNEWGRGGEYPHTIFYFDCQEQWSDNILSCAGDQSKLPAGKYRWKIKTIIAIDDTNDMDLSGSESPWAYFTIE